MKRVFKRIFKITVTVGVVLGVAGTIWFMSGEGVDTPDEIRWGASFSPQQAIDLGLDWREVYIALLDDMGVRHLRLAAPWRDVSSAQGVYDFSDIDWMLTEAEKRGAVVNMAIGRKLFRWPECHDPDWVYGVSSERFDDLVLEFVRDSVEHFRDFGAIKAWQVENEPIFPFGECYGPQPTKELFAREVALVRTLDNRPITSTDSGELSSWLSVGQYVDELGVSLYRVTENPTFGRFYYPIRPGFYQKKAAFTKAINKNLDRVFLSELQLEPWTTGPLSHTSLREQFESMNISRTRATLAFAQKTGFDEIYLWGVEWWYWLMSEHGDGRFWELGKSVM